ncbi:MAG: HAD hydrolase-like protein [Candidatus Micrarchaeota archaeon]|nr:HAD hydrolase-like protein [Candidatus Micrarchaeota archaeon]
MALKAIIFDIDGVLADSREAVVHNTIEVLSEFGFGALREKVEGMSSAHSTESVLIALVPKLAGDRELLKKMLLSLSKATVNGLLLRFATLSETTPQFFGILTESGSI